jgi:hypothetical protein
MAKRQIFVTTAQIVDSTGLFATLPGYPKTFDSRNYNNDIDKAQNRALGEYHEVLGAFYKRDDRQLQTAICMTASGFILASQSIGQIADAPDSE